VIEVASKPIDLVQLNQLVQRAAAAPSVDV
jgi:hypothetical protein